MPEIVGNHADKIQTKIISSLLQLGSISRDFEKKVLIGNLFAQSKINGFLENRLCKMGVAPQMNR